MDSIKVLPYEFSIIGTKWEKWEIIDTIISLKIMSFMVATDGMYELIRYYLINNQILKII